VLGIQRHWAALVAVDVVRYARRARPGQFIAHVRPTCGHVADAQVRRRWRRAQA
jgi:hypothetical protein